MTSVAYLVSPHAKRSIVECAKALEYWLAAEHGVLHVELKPAMLAELPGIKSHLSEQAFGWATGALK